MLGTELGKGVRADASVRWRELWSLRSLETGSIHWQGWLTWKEMKTQRRDGAAVSLGHLSEANTYAHSNPKGRMFLSSMKPVLNLPR